MKSEEQAYFSSLYQRRDYYAPIHRYGIISATAVNSYEYVISENPAGEESIEARQDWKKLFKADTTDRLLEPGETGVRYLTLCDFFEDTVVPSAVKRKADVNSPIAEFLSNTDEERFRVKQGRNVSLCIPVLRGTELSRPCLLYLLPDLYTEE